MKSSSALVDWISTNGNRLHDRGLLIWMEPISSCDDYLIRKRILTEIDRIRFDSKILRKKTRSLQTFFLFNALSFFTKKTFIGFCIVTLSPNIYHPLSIESSDSSQLYLSSILFFLLLVLIYLFHSTSLCINTSHLHIFFEKKGSILENE